MVWKNVIILGLLIHTLNAFPGRGNLNIRQSKVIGISESTTNENDLEYYVEDNESNDVGEKPIDEKDDIKKQTIGNVYFNPNMFTKVSESNSKQWGLNFVQRQPHGRRVIKFQKNHLPHLTDNGKILSENGHVPIFSKSGNLFNNRNKLPSQSHQTKQQNKQSLLVPVTSSHTELPLTSSSDSSDFEDDYYDVGEHPSLETSHSEKNVVALNKNVLPNISLQKVKKPLKSSNALTQDSLHQNQLSHKINSEYDYEIESSTQPVTGIAEILKSSTFEIFTSIEPLKITSKKPPQTQKTKAKHKYNNKLPISTSTTQIPVTLKKDDDYDYEEIEPIISTSQVYDLQTISSALENVRKGDKQNNKSIKNKNVIVVNGESQLKVTTESSYNYDDDYISEKNNESIIQSNEQNSSLNKNTISKLINSTQKTDDFDYYFDEHVESISSTSFTPTSQSVEITTKNHFSKKMEEVTKSVILNKNLSKHPNFSSTISSKKKLTPSDTSTLASNNKNDKYEVLDYEEIDKNIDILSTTSNQNLNKEHKKTLELSSTQPSVTLEITTKLKHDLSTKKPISTFLKSTTANIDNIAETSNDDYDLEMSSTMISTTLEHQSESEDKQLDKSSSGEYSSELIKEKKKHITVEKKSTRDNNETDNEIDEELTTIKPLSLLKYTVKNVYDRTKSNKRYKLSKTTPIILKNTTEEIKSNNSNHNDEISDNLTLSNTQETIDSESNTTVVPNNFTTMSKDKDNVETTISEMITESTSPDYIEEDYDQFVQTNPFKNKLKLKVNDSFQKEKEFSNNNYTTTVSSDIDNDEKEVDIELLENNQTLQTSHKHAAMNDKLMESYSNRVQETSIEKPINKKSSNKTKELKYKTASKVDKETEKNINETTTSNSLNQKKKNSTKKIELQISSTVNSLDNDYLDEVLSTTISSDNASEDLLLTTLQPETTPTLANSDSLEELMFETTSASIVLTNSSRKGTNDGIHSTSITNIPLTTASIGKKKSVKTTLKTKNTQTITSQSFSTSTDKIHNLQMPESTTFDDYSEEIEFTTESILKTKQSKMKLKVTKQTPEVSDLTSTTSDLNLEVTEPSEKVDFYKHDLKEKNIKVKENLDSQNDKNVKYFPDSSENIQSLEKKIKGNTIKHHISTSTIKPVSNKKSSNHTLEVTNIGQSISTDSIIKNNIDNDVTEAMPLPFQTTTSMVLIKNKSGQNVTSGLVNNDGIRKKAETTVNFLNKSGPVWSKVTNSHIKKPHVSMVKPHAINDQKYSDSNSHEIFERPICNSLRGTINNETILATCDGHNVTFISWKGFKSLRITACSSEPQEDNIIFTDVRPESEEEVDPSRCQLIHESGKCVQEYTQIIATVLDDDKRIRECVKIPFRCDCQSSLK